MLEYLKIENLALLDAASLEFGGGFTALTGETGAGKSVLLGALALLAGSRAGREIVKRGRESCSVEALLSFKDASAVDEFLESCGLPKCEENSLVLKRQIGLQKSSKCFVNNALANASILRELGEFWVDFHGTNEPQKLFSAKNQLALLDAYANLDSAKVGYFELYERYCQNLKKLEELKSAKQMSADEIQFVKSQIGAIDALNISEESIAELESSFKLIENARALVEKSLAINSAISGEGGVLDSLTSAVRMASEIAEASDGARELMSRLKNLSIELDDVASEYSSLADTCSFSEREAAEIREKMDLWLSLQRKYGRGVEAVLEARGNMLERLELQGDVKSAIASAEREIADLQGRMEPLKAEIFELRKRAAISLEKKVISLLKKLGFKKPAFKIEISLEEGFDKYCASACEFMFSANPGQPELPLAKVASSGELARVMLSLKAILAEVDSTELLVFDEVDANVGGEIGAELGRVLSSLSKEHQVLCVTHLPQVAAMANSHFLVKKIQTNTDTSVEISELDAKGDSRVSELARMLGDRNSASAIAHAKELLKKS